MKNFRLTDLLPGHINLQHAHLHGFSLIEVMIATVIMLLTRVVIVEITSTFKTSAKTYQQQQ